jgi:hypothetical protein
MMLCGDHVVCCHQIHHMDASTILQTPKFPIFVVVRCCCQESLDYPTTNKYQPFLYNSVMGQIISVNQSKSSGEDLDWINS